MHCLHESWRLQHYKYQVTICNIQSHRWSQIAYNYYDVLYALLEIQQAEDRAVQWVEFVFHFVAVAIKHHDCSSVGPHENKHTIHGSHTQYHHTFFQGCTLCVCVWERERGTRTISNLIESHSIILFSRLFFFPMLYYCHYKYYWRSYKVYFL